MCRKHVACLLWENSSFGCSWWKREPQICRILPVECCSASMSNRHERSDFLQTFQYVSALEYRLIYSPFVGICMCYSALCSAYSVSIVLQKKEGKNRIWHKIGVQDTSLGFIESDYPTQRNKGRKKHSVSCQESGHRRISQKQKHF